jgi:hypothetical protein
VAGRVLPDAGLIRYIGVTSFLGKSQFLSMKNGSFKTEVLKEYPLKT